MASVERLSKYRGVVRARVMQTIMLLTDKLQPSVPDATQVDSHVAYLIQKNVELVNLNKEIFDATDDNAYEKELEASEEHERKVSYAVSPSIIVSSRAWKQSDGNQYFKVGGYFTEHRHWWCRHRSTRD
ncbi:hypothetical protein HPB52_023217 [Rhipicephalus sanguineus]|uniref:Uncharacterized protein n=1 Tax=Rhipicephalus sanguineus TaxID=34632 RepID=A0A9D4T885_RHISA|nr:hypothetical protein HPB52_023217 [Rhipicephalus sanguineus]